MTQIARDQAQIIAPKIYGYYDNIPNPINAEVVLLELVRAPVLPSPTSWPEVPDTSYVSAPWRMLGRYLDGPRAATNHDRMRKTRGAAHQTLQLSQPPALLRD